MVPVPYCITAAILFRNYVNIKDSINDHTNTLNTLCRKQRFLITHCNKRQGRYQNHKTEPAKTASVYIQHRINV